MEVIYLVFFFSWSVRNGAAFDMETLPQASIEQCEKNGEALKEVYREIKWKCIPGLAEGAGTPISTEEIMSRYGYKDSTY